MENEIYASPNSNVVDKKTEPAVVRMYSPIQVAFGALGGPVALVYFLAANFKALGKNSHRNRTIILGMLFIILFMALWPSLPESTPTALYAIVYMLVGQSVAENYQMKKEEIIESERHEFHSNWRVLGFAASCFCGSLAVLLAPLLYLTLSGAW